MAVHTRSCEEGKCSRNVSNGTIFFTNSRALMASTTPVVIAITRKVENASVEQTMARSMPRHLYLLTDSLDYVSSRDQSFRLNAHGCDRTDEVHQPKSPARTLHLSDSEDGKLNKYSISAGQQNEPNTAQRTDSSDISSIHVSMKWSAGTFTSSADLPGPGTMSAFRKTVRSETETSISWNNFQCRFHGIDVLEIQLDVLL